MVRGTPFLGADDWKLGFNLQANRADISSKLTDAAHELTARALAAGNLPLARWATSQGRTADPLNQTLMADAVRIEDPSREQGRGRHAWPTGCRRPPANWAPT